MSLHHPKSYLANNLKLTYILAYKTRIFWQNLKPIFSFYHSTYMQVIKRNNYLGPYIRGYIPVCCGCMCGRLRYPGCRVGVGNPGCGEEEEEEEKDCPEPGLPSFSINTSVQWPASPRRSFKAWFSYDYTFPIISTRLMFKIYKQHFVVYFDQQMGALHARCWLELSFCMF